MKKIDIHKDYTLYNLHHTLCDLVTTMFSYFQSNTPYCDIYKKTFNQLTKVRKDLDKLESCLAECQEVKGYGEKND